MKMVSNRQPVSFHSSQVSYLRGGQNVFFWPKFFCMRPREDKRHDKIDLIVGKEWIERRDRK